MTHHVQYLPHADHVIYLENGRIVEQGTYTDLLKSGSALAQLSSESGGNVQAKALEAGTKEDSDEGKTEVAAEEPKGDEKPKEKPSALMQAEERATGSLGWKSESHARRELARADSPRRSSLGFPQSWRRLRHWAAPLLDNFAHARQSKYVLYAP